MAAPVLSNFSKKTNIVVSTVDCGINGGVITLSLGSADIAPLLASGFDVVPFLADGVTIPTFTRLSYASTPSPVAQLYVTLPTGSTGAGSNYTLIIGSGYSGATDQSTALAKTGPYPSGDGAAVALSWYPMLAGDTSTTSSPDALSNNGLVTPAANNLTLVGTPTRGASIIPIVGTTSLFAGKSFTTNGTSSYGHTAAAATSPIFAASGFSAFTHGMWITTPASFASNPVIWSVNGVATKLQILSTGKLRLSVAGGNVVNGTTVLATSTTYFIGFTFNANATSIYVNGVLDVTGLGQPLGINGDGSATSTAVSFYYGCNNNTGTPAGFVAATYDNIWFAAESYTVADMLAAYYNTMSPVGLVPKRKLTRLAAAGGFTEGQLITSSTTGAPVGFIPLENAVLWYPNGAPRVAGNPYGVGVVQDRNTSIIYLMTCTSPDPRNRAAWTIGAPLVGTGGISGITSGSGAGQYFVEPCLTEDVANGKYLITWPDPGYTSAANNGISGVTSPDLATGWSGLLTLISPTQQAAAASGNINSFYVHKFTQLSSGSFMLLIESGLVSGAPTGNFVMTAWEAPNLTNGGTYTYNATVTAALAAAIPDGGNAFFGGPGLVTYNNGLYMIVEGGSEQNYFLIGLSTDTTNLTSYTNLSDPVLESAVAWEVFAYATEGTGQSNPSVIIDGAGTTHVIYAGGPDGGTANSLGIASYPGTPDKLFATGTEILSTSNGANMTTVPFSFTPTVSTVATTTADIVTQNNSGTMTATIAAPGNGTLSWQLIGRNQSGDTGVVLRTDASTPQAEILESTSTANSPISPSAEIIYNFKGLPPMPLYAFKLTGGNASGETALVFGST
jgi:hypothetical protein